MMHYLNEFINYTLLIINKMFYLRQSDFKTDFNVKQHNI